VLQSCRAAVVRRACSYNAAASCMTCCFGLTESEYQHTLVQCGALQHCCPSLTRFSAESALPGGRLEESSEGRCVGSAGFAYLFSGRNSGIRGSALSTFAKVNTATHNGVWIHFEGAKAACEQHAGSTAASSFAPEPAAARSGCLRRSLCLLTTSLAYNCV
jgi:hypothetical protein